MIRATLLAALTLASIGGLTQAQQQDPAAMAARLRTVGQAVMMYAADYKGQLPPNLGSLKVYLKDEADAVERDFVYTGRLGTRLAHLRTPAQIPLAMNKPGANEPLLVVFVDGHVQAFAPVNLERIARMPGVATTQRTMLVAGDAPIPTEVPADVAAALGGAWTVDLGDHTATYQFNADGDFTLRFVKSPKSYWRGPGAGQASGTWKLDGKKLVMKNTASDTPFTITGETEEAEVVGLDASALVLKSQDAGGGEEQTVLRRAFAFVKGKRDNAKIVGTWNQDRMTLVIADSGLAVLGPMKGEWSQHGNQLMLFLPHADFAQREAKWTIDHVDDTTLVLTGSFLGKEPATYSFLRVK